MKIIYVPRKMSVIFDYIARIMSKRYTDCYNVRESMKDVKYFKHMFMIIKLDKQLDTLAEILTHIDRINLVETMDHYYLSMNVYEICDIIYNQHLTIFSEQLRSCYEKYYVNIFNSKLLGERLNKDGGHIDYDTMYNTLPTSIISDTYTISLDCMGLLSSNEDLAVSDLRKLFFVTTKLLSPIDYFIELNENLKYPVLHKNSFCSYNKQMYSELNRWDHDNVSFETITVSEEIEGRSKTYNLKTTIFKLAHSLLNMVKRYSNSAPIVSRLVPISTLADGVITMSLADIKTQHDEDLVSGVFTYDFLMRLDDNMDFIMNERIPDRFSKYTIRTNGK